VTRAAKGSLARARPFLALVALITLTFFMGGSGRSDIQSLVILRPAAVLFLGFGLLGLRWTDVRAYRVLFGLAFAVFVLVLCHLVPLPPLVWGALPGRGIVSEVDKVTGLGAVWRPISLVPAGTWNAFYSLFIPLAVLVLGVQLDREQRYLLLPVLLVLGLLSGLFGLLQSVGSASGSLYFYAITNEGSAVGLFANRNHQALLLACLFPMLAVFASEHLRSPERVRHRLWIAGAAGTVIIPLLLVTGSRSGLLVGIIGLGSTAFIYRKPPPIVLAKRRVRNLKPLYVLGLGAVLALGALTALFSRAQVFERLTSPDSAEELRFEVWPDILDIAWKYFPIGSGMGSFVEVYQIDERLGSISTKYLNHAHNDWLETFVTGGVPALLIVMAASFAWGQVTLEAVRKRNLSAREHKFALLGSTILLLLGIASIFDYPLRTPTLMCFAIIAAIWSVRRTDIRLPDRSTRASDL
jgi:MFS family permease